MGLLNKKVFFPPLILLLGTVVYSFINEDGFLQLVQGANQWILQHFGWLFSWSTFLFLIILIVLYVTPFGRIKIGGANAQPILSRWRWFSITLCTTIATGILFWGTAEPLYHLNSPPSGLGLDQASPEAATFALSTMLMHWTLTPYAIYTLAGLVFAIAYYNLRQPFSLGSMLFPLIGKKAHGFGGTMIDIICLFGLVAGMAASLGTGILTIMGGMGTVAGVPKSDLLLGLITMVIVLTFILSAASGLMKGIRILSDINIKAFIGLAIFFFIAGPSWFMLKLGAEGIIDYFYHFIPRSIHWDTGIETEWLDSWTIFYWANWLAWTPVTALFLGRLSVGYTVRDYVHYNLLLPSLFSGIWMMIFSGAAIDYDVKGDGLLHTLLTNEGAEYVIFQLMEDYPIGNIISFVFLMIIFVSYVTAADSNTSAMSGMSSKGITPENPEAPLWIKIVWGTLIGLVAWVMITSAGIEGIKMTSILGGFPALFLMIALAIGVIKLLILFLRGEDLNG